MGEVGVFGVGFRFSGGFWLFGFGGEWLDGHFFFFFMGVAGDG